MQRLSGCASFSKWPRSQGGVFTDTDMRSWLASGGLIVEAILKASGRRGKPRPLASFGGWDDPLPLTEDGFLARQGSIQGQTAVALSGEADGFKRSSDLAKGLSKRKRRTCPAPFGIGAGNPEDGSGMK